MEVASHRLTVEARCDGDQKALERDLDEMIGRRPKQLRRSIDAMKPGRPGIAATLRYERLDPDRIARFWPMIITMTPIHWSPLLEEFLTPALGELDGRDDVEALDVLAVEDLESLVAITEETGRSSCRPPRSQAGGPGGPCRPTQLAGPGPPGAEPGPAEISRRCAQRGNGRRRPTPRLRGPGRRSGRLTAPPRRSTIGGETTRTAVSPPGRSP